MWDVSGGPGNDLIGQRLASGCYVPGEEAKAWNSVAEAWEEPMGSRQGPLAEGQGSWLQTRSRVWMEQLEVWCVLPLSLSFPMCRSEITAWRPR